MAVNCLLDGKDVLAVLPTSFGNIANTLIFQTWVKATRGLVCSGVLQCWSNQEEQLFLFNITH